MACTCHSPHSTELFMTWTWVASKLTIVITSVFNVLLFNKCVRCIGHWASNCMSCSVAHHYMSYRSWQLKRTEHLLRNNFSDEGKTTLCLGVWASLRQNCMCHRCKTKSNQEWNEYVYNENLTGLWFMSFYFSCPQILISFATLCQNYLSVTHLVTGSSKWFSAIMSESV